MFRRAALGLLLCGALGTTVRTSHAQPEPPPPPPPQPIAPEVETSVDVVSSAPPAEPPTAPVESVVVRAPREIRSPGSTTLPVGARTRAMAGALGDGLAVAQSLPGVARPPAGSSQIVVWGAAPSESRIYVDDVPIPYLYHRGGLRSVVGAELISSLELVPAAFGASYGRATGGLVRLRTSLLSGEGVHGHVSVDPLDSSASLRYTEPETRGPWAFAVGGRYGYFDRVLRAVAPDSSFPASAYADLATKIVHRDDDAITELTVLGAVDDVNRRIPEARSTRARVERAQESFGRLSLRRTYGKTALLLWLGRDLAAGTSDFGAALSGQRAESWRAGARVSTAIVARDDVSLRLGADVEVARHDLSRTGTVSLPAREGDLVVFGQSPSQRIAVDDWVNHFVGAAPYLEAEWRPSPAWRVVPGFRLETFVLEGNRLRPEASGGVDVGYSRLVARPDPRLVVEYRVSDAISVRGAGGAYHQPPDPLDASAVFGSPSLEPSSALHGLFGATWEIEKVLDLEAATFAKVASGLTVRSSLDPPRLAENLVATGEGRTLGAQGTVRVQKWKTISGWLTYTFSRAERRDDERSAWRRFDFDQPHALTLVASVEPFEGWRFGTRLRAASGYPRARVVGAYYEPRIGSYQPIRDGRERLPAFVQLDLHAERAITWGASTIVAYLDVVNVLDRSNAEEAVYGYDYRDRSYLTGYPLLALVGVRFER